MPCKWYREYDKFNNINKMMALNKFLKDQQMVLKQVLYVNVVSKKKMLQIFSNNKIEILYTFSFSFRF